MENDTQHKIIYLEVLRVIAMLSVVLLHVTSKAISLVEVHTTAWHIYNFVRCFCKWGVNIFIMISGTLFLDPQKDLTISKLYRKYIRKILVMLISWSFIYAVYPLLRDCILKKEILWVERLQNIFRCFVLGNYHLWYLYMIIGLYMLTPFLREIAKNKQNLKYFLELSAIFSVIMPLLSNIDFFELFVTCLDQLHLNMIMGYTFLFMLGYYLSICDFSCKQIQICKVICVAELFLTVVITCNNEGYLFLVDGVFSIGITIMVTCLFIIFKYSSWSTKPIFTKLIMLISDYSLGIYLIHALFVHYITLKSVDWFKPGLDIIASFFVILGISFTIVCLLKRIPYIRKIIV